MQLTRPKAAPLRHLLLAGLLLAASSAHGQQMTAETGYGEAGSDQLNVLEVLMSGGWVMVPLGIISLLTLILIFYCLLTIRRGAVVTRRFMERGEQMLREGDLESLGKFASRRNEMVARVLDRATYFLEENPRAQIEEVREVAEAEGSRQAGIYLQRISYLADVAAIAPMVGLLGTVIGMIRAFYEISRDAGGVKQMELSSGVSEALITTATGLVIGIIAMAFYSFFRSRVQRYLAELESATTHLMAVMSPRLTRVGPATPEAVPTHPGYSPVQPHGHMPPHVAHPPQQGYYPPQHQPAYYAQPEPGESVTLPRGYQPPAAPAPDPEPSSTSGSGSGEQL